ncbi:ABC transporter permease [Streptomyces sp. PSRA5]|uniref:ABC transporter permease n=1 Tax=Streptomyces panacea TaxID=3035064 RepID=UPI00339BDE01
MRGRQLSPARLSGPDAWEVGSAGLRGRPIRVILSALGIALGIATMISVVGISESSKADLMRQLDRIGTNMLQITPGQSFGAGEEPRLPEQAPAMIGQLKGVDHVGAVGKTKASIYRSEHIDSGVTSGIDVLAASEPLLDTLRATMASGTWLNGATGQYPAVVLGHVSAERLGVATAGQNVFIEGRYFTVIGILDPLPLAPDIERSAMVGWEAAETLLGFDGHPTMIFERSADDKVSEIQKLLARTANPAAPGKVTVSNPSDALAAKASSEAAFTNLLLGLGAVALLVGGVGVANTMIISVLERRHEIGLRRSLGATRGQIRLQFVTEALMLSGLGGLAGVVLGSAATWIYAASTGIPWVVPPWAMGSGFVATLFIGSAAGLYPAVRAARLSPTLALQAA